MCEIDVTDFFTSEDLAKYSASAMELGQNAGRITWINALSAPRLLTTEAHFDALRQWAKDTGAWDEQERNAWSEDECNALFVQIISGDMRELESLCMSDDGEIDWQEAESLASQGTISGCLYRGDNGRVYFYLGS